MTLTAEAMFLTPALIALTGACVGLGLDAWSRSRAAVHVVAWTLLAASVAAALGIASTPVAALGALQAGGGFATVAAVVYGLSGLVVLGGLGSLRTRASGPPSAAIIALAAIGAHALVSATDLAVLVVAIEIVAIAGYALVAAAHTDASREAAVKYVIQGAVATALGILGIGLAFAFGGGELAYGPVSDALKAEGGREVLLAAVLVLSLLVFKVGGFPFHSWAPDAFETAKPAEAAFLASVPKLAAFTALVVLFNASVFAGAMPVTATLFGILAAASIAFGNLAALGQQSVGRMLGYSAIAHAGYGLVGLAAGGAASLTAIFFAGTYALGAVLAFLGLQAVRDARPSWDGSRSGLSGLAGTAPWASAVVAVGMLSLTGMPLFVGFWGKLAVFIAAVQAGHTWLAVVGVIGSVISFGYYGAVIRSLYFESPAEGGDEAVPARRSRSAIAVAILLAAVVVLLGVLPLLTGLTPAYSLLTFR